MPWVRLTGYVRDGSGRHAPGTELEVNEHSMRRLLLKGGAALMLDPEPEKEVSILENSIVGESEPLPLPKIGKGKVGNAKPGKKGKGVATGH